MLKNQVLTRPLIKGSQLRNVPRCAPFIQQMIPIRTYGYLPVRSTSKTTLSLSDSKLKSAYFGMKYGFPMRYSSQTPQESQKQDVAESPKPEQKPVAPVKKASIWQRLKGGVLHFWDGTRLLGVEIKISSKLVYKMAVGYEMTRRESRQLTRTLKDIGRLVPFSMFVIVPFAELLLPIAVKLFPNLLPSTFEDPKDKQAKKEKLRKVRSDVSGVLRDTIKSGKFTFSDETSKSKEFRDFFLKVRTSGQSPSRQELINVCQYFKDDITLDNLSRAQLIALCRYMNLNAFGTDPLLRYNIRSRMRQIRRDDRAIYIEGINSLSVPELFNACNSRGIRSQGLSPAKLKDEMSVWLEMRIKHGIPSVILMLSNAFSYGYHEGTYESRWDALQDTLASIPDELYHETVVDMPSEEISNKQRLEILREQEELIEEEAENPDVANKVKDTASGPSMSAKPKDNKKV
ncbi:mitochondrial inner membrane protein involved in translation Mdm28 [Schizosaccharomyces osmophilus]|uniref:Mitochondrial inner membrane protein involved in translation Mdm28 n=1 Tax=Schizosaccharomyces osmophilus TaxID=2545709 RepID=A0AAE9WDM8_9SCHI|nr:mitochondrial inner membrane protein involved in translation Mdm28 [Schizosaccharomyces osmophilus]WBW73674.1 mitochondrial inner membrane protein involved in translation Mdm28 [Schizosaccharomyces osmophilus]